MGPERHGAPDYRVRTALDGDMPVVRDLYNALIPTTTVAWTEKPETLRERMTWYRAQQRAGYPVLVVEIKFTEWTSAGNIRQPTFLGTRADKDPREVVREVPV